MTGSAGSLDSNVVLRLLVGDVPQQQTAALSLVSSGRLGVADAAVIEVIFVLGRNYGLTRLEQRDTVRDLLAQPTVEGNAELFDAAFEIYIAHSKLSFEDCYLVSHAELHGNGPLWTFDRTLARQTNAELVAP